MKDKWIVIIAINKFSKTKSHLIRVGPGVEVLGTLIHLRGLVAAGTERGEGGE